MKKRTLIVIIISLVILVTVCIVFFLTSKITSRTAFLNLNKISCISINGSSKDQSNSEVNAYSQGETILEGYLYDESDAKEFVYNLIEERIINTFMHTSADVCLTSYSEDEQEITLNYKARQVYYTNEENVEIYTFAVNIQKNDNSIMVIGK